MARKWRRCAVPDPCMRVPWGEGSRGVGVGARGSCQGGAPSSALRTGFDRLRANGFGRGAGGGEWGMRWGDGDAPRRAPALGSRESGNDDGGCGGMRWREGFGSGWGPALAGGRFANRPYDRGGAHEGGGDAGAAGGGGAPFECPQDRLRQAQGERIWEGRGRWGVGDAMGGRRRPAPRTCPGFPRERERRWGVWWDALARGVRVRVGARSRGRAVREPPLRPGWGARGRG